MHVEWSVWTSWLVELPIEEALDCFLSWGFASLELSVEHFNELLARSGEEAYLDDTESFKNRALALASRGPIDPTCLSDVEFVHAHGPFSPFNLKSPSELDKSVKIVKKWIQWCIKIPVDVLVCHPFRVEGMSEGGLEELNLSGFRALEPEARDCGVILAVENMGRGYGSKAVHLLRIIESCENIALCVDTGHANLEAYRGRVHDLIDEAGRWMVATHLSDNDGSSDQHLFPGRGSIGWERVFASIVAAGYEKPINLEIPGELREYPDPQKRLEHLKHQLRLLEQRLRG